MSRWRPHDFFLSSARRVFSGRDKPSLVAQPSVPLTYSTALCSGYSGVYDASHTKVDNPLDQSSRWSDAFYGNAKQWVLLELEAPAVLKSITFGKFHKPHPCNVKEFKLYVGSTKDHMSEVLHSSLKNDSTPESFLVKHTNDAGVEFPTRFLKIVPISPHGQSFHISIWYVALTGIADQRYVEHITTVYEQYRETIILRHILKHLRQRRLLSPYQDILNRSGLSVEHSLVSRLHDVIVLKGDWKEAENMLVRLAQASLFDKYLHTCQPHALWKRLHTTGAESLVPSARGGHAMCIDSQNGSIYIFGGWDGDKSLDDFWRYDIKNEQWQKFDKCPNSPAAMSCHKMAFDSKTGDIFLLGGLRDAHGTKFIEQNVRDETYSSEFFCYHTRDENQGRWERLSADTASLGGPPLVYDHQMAIDNESHTLFVFGGRIIDGDWNSSKYAGLYSYTISSKKWTTLQQPDAPPYFSTIPSRSGHSMVLEPSSNTLLIFAGQREDKFLSDLHAYDIKANTNREIYSNFTSFGGPDACFTQRAVIDPQLSEVYIVCGLTRKKPEVERTTIPARFHSWVYRYHSHPGIWTRIHSEKVNKEGGAIEEPCPRYAAQVVYDPSAKILYLHGGTAGVSPLKEMAAAGASEEAEEKQQRLDDFWSMTLARPSQDELIRKAKYQIRQQQFRELCDDSSAIDALKFLQNDVSDVVNHENYAEEELFRSLLSHLLAPPPKNIPTTPPSHLTEEPPRKKSRPFTLNGEEIDAYHSMASIGGEVLTRDSDPLEEPSSDGQPMSAERFKQRNGLFESLLEFISADAKYPAGNLLDLVSLEMASL